MSDRAADRVDALVWHLTNEAAVLQSCPKKR